MGETRMIRPALLGPHLTSLSAALVLRGAAAVTLALYMFWRPPVDLGAFGFLFALFAVVDGCLVLPMCARLDVDNPHRKLQRAGGVATLIGGLTLLVVPGNLVLACLLFAWVMLSTVNILLLDSPAAVRGWYAMVALLGLLLFCMLLLWSPGPIVLAILIGAPAYLLIYGGALGALGLHLWRDRD